MICENQNKNGSKWMIQSLSLVLPVFNSHFPSILECLWLWLWIFECLRHPFAAKGCTFANKKNWNSQVTKFLGKKREKKTDWVGSFQVKRKNRTRLPKQTSLNWSYWSHLTPLNHLKTHPVAQKVHRNLRGVFPSLGICPLEMKHPKKLGWTLKMI